MPAALAWEYRACPCQSPSNQKDLGILKLINFNNDEAQAVEKILIETGMTSNLGLFLSEHLTQVLRGQHPDVEITSVEFVKAHNFSGGGMPSPDPTIVNLDSMCLPIEVKVAVRGNQNSKTELQLRVELLGKIIGNAWSFSSNVFVLDQTYPVVNS